MHLVFGYILMWKINDQSVLSGALVLKPVNFSNFYSYAISGVPDIHAEVHKSMFNMDFNAFDC